MKNKLLVVSVDALVYEDLAFATSLPGFSYVANHGCRIEKVTSVFPTLTYPIHVVQMTGRNMMYTGVWNNEIFQPGRLEPDWCWDIAYCKVPTIFDAAKRAGLTTGAIMWPVTASADIDYCIPEVWDLHVWDDPTEIYRKHCSKEGFSIFQNHKHTLGWHPLPAMDEFAVNCAEEILLYDQPDVFFIHVSAVDIARHRSGMYTQQVKDAIVRVDAWLQRFFKAMEKTGNLDHTNIVISSDHGHQTVKKQVNLNTILVDRGYITLGENGIDYTAYCHSAGLSSQVILKDEDDLPTRQAVFSLLQELKSNPEYGIKEVYTRDEVEKKFKLSGGFLFVIEGYEGVAFGHACTGRTVKLPTDADYTYVHTSHGHIPEEGNQPIFLAKGPDFLSDITLPTRSILDEVPTYAQLLGVSLPGLEGRPIIEFLR